MYSIPLPQSEKMALETLMAVLINLAKSFLGLQISAFYEAISLYAQPIKIKN
jgi:hypothetical protein